MQPGAYVMLLVYGALALLHGAMAAPCIQEARENPWSQFILHIGRSLGMLGHKHSSTFAVDLGMPPTGDNWFWSLNGWTMAESEVSVVDREPILTFATRPALFGTHIVNSPGLLGHLLPLNSFTVHVNASLDDIQTTIPETVPYPITEDNTGCPPLNIPEGYPHPSMNESWIALVMRGKCGFDEKVRQAQQLGARAAIIGGRPPTTGVDELISMSPASDGRDIAIPAVYVTHATYAALIELIAMSNMSTSGLRTVSIVLGPEETWAWWSPILSFAILLLLPSIMTLVTLFIHRIRAARHAARQRAPGDVVRALPIRVWTGAGWVSEKDWLASHAHDSLVTPSEETIPAPSQDPVSQEGTTGAHTQSVPDSEPVGVPNWFASQGECAICLSSFVRGDRVRVLPCGHVFHVEEVDGWLLNRRKVCPICKADVTHPAPRTSARVFPVAVHPSEAENRTVAGSGVGILEGDGSGVGSALDTSVSGGRSSTGWWGGNLTRVWDSGPGHWWQRARERQGHATERTPLLPS